MDFAIFGACALAIALAGPLLVDGVEGVAERTGLGHLWLGTVLLAGATSLPELVSMVSAAAIDEPDIAVGTVLGSNMFNMTIFAVVLIFFPMAVKANRAGAMTGGLAIALGAGMLVFIAVGLPSVGLPEGGRLGVGAIALLGVYVVGSYVLFREERGAPRALDVAEETAGPAPVALGASVAGGSSVARGGRARSARGVAGRLLVATGVVFVASLFLPDAAEGIADTLGVSGGVVGVVGVALATSLPEVVTSGVALSRGAPELVVGNVFGSNVFNVAALLPADAALNEGALLDVVLNEQAVAAAFGLGLMLLALAPLLERAPWPGWTGGAAVDRRRRMLRLVGLAILTGYVAGVVVTVALGVETG